MSPYLIAAMLCAAVVVGILIHKYLPTGVVAEVKKAETAVKADLPDLEADAMAALSKGMAWLTDTTAEVAAKAKADASIAKKNALRAQAATALAASSSPAA